MLLSRERPAPAGTRNADGTPVVALRLSVCNVHRGSKLFRVASTLPLPGSSLCGAGFAAARVGGRGMRRSSSSWREQGTAVLRERQRLHLVVTLHPARTVASLEPARHTNPSRPPVAKCSPSGAARHTPNHVRVPRLPAWTTGRSSLLPWAVREVPHADRPAHITLTTRRSVRKARQRTSLLWPSRATGESSLVSLRRNSRMGLLRRQTAANRPLGEPAIAIATAWSSKIYSVHES